MYYTSEKFWKRVYELLSVSLLLEISWWMKTLQIICILRVKSVKFTWCIISPASSFSTNEGCGEKLLFCRIMCPRWATGVRVIEFKIIFSYNHLETADLVTSPSSHNKVHQTCCTASFTGLDRPIFKDLDVDVELFLHFQTLGESRVTVCAFVS